MASGAPPDVFISYASGDKTVADQACATLEGRGIRCWIAPRDARPGINYGASIVDAIDASSVLVFVVSSRAIASPHVQVPGPLPSIARLSSRRRRLGYLLFGTKFCSTI